MRSKIAIMDGGALFDSALLAALTQLPEIEMINKTGEPNINPAELELRCVEGRAQLTNNITKSRILVSFVQNELKRRLQPANLNGELVVRAVVGRRKKAGLRVLDATAGLGRDALLLAGAGCEITLVERMPVLAILLQQAVQQAQSCDDAILVATAQRMNCVMADSLKALDNSLSSSNDSLGLLHENLSLSHSSQQIPSDASQITPDVVYLDPMYQPSGEATVVGLKPSAAVNKHMATLQALTRIYAQHYPQMQSTDESAKVFELALARATSKVVVKRAPKAAYLAGHKPSSTIAGKAARFDVYAC